jgi:hypothetical protein
MTTREASNRAGCTLAMASRASLDWVTVLRRTNVSPAVLITFVSNASVSSSYGTPSSSETCMTGRYCVRIGRNSKKVKRGMLSQIEIRRQRPGETPILLTVSTITAHKSVAPISVKNSIFPVCKIAANISCTLEISYIIFK